MSRARAMATSATALLAAPALAAPGRLGGGAALEVSLGRIVTALLICIIIAVLAVLLIRQRSGKIDLAALFAKFEARPRSIRIVETRRLSQHADICVVRHHEREYLLLLMAGEARVLDERAFAPSEAGGEA